MKRKRFCWVVGVCLGSIVLGQTGIVGSATVSVADGGMDCGGMARVVDVHVDISGLSGVGGAAGLNSFVLAFNISRQNVFASAIPGDEPDLGWGLRTTSQNQIAVTDTVILVGWAPDTNAPNADHWVASMLFSGTSGSVTLTFDPSASSLGSRVVNGDGPGSIDLVGPSPFSFTIPANFDLDLLTGVSYWRTENPDYNLVPDSSLVTVLDLVKLVQCGG